MGKKEGEEGREESTLLITQLFQNEAFVVWS
jgi:hypothetical protein